MKRIKLIIAVLAISSVIACAQSKETRKLGSFNKIQSSGFFDVELTKGNEEAAQIEATNFPLDKLIMEVEGNILKIYQENYYKPSWGAKVKIYITYKQLESIKKSGSGNLLCRSDISGTESYIESSGSGNIKIAGIVKADNVYAHISGSGNIFLNQIEAQSLHMDKSGSGNFSVESGNVDNQELSSSGSGNISSEGLASNDCRISMSGSGNASVNASKSLDANIAGSGNIRYKGNPQLNSHVAGSGHIRSF
jgi:hypothetical protein